jgi:hypothetical protein
MRLPLDQMWLLRQTTEVEVPVAEDDSIMLRVELFENDQPDQHHKQYRFRVFRYDMFRILPSSSAGDATSARHADHEFLIVDPTFDLTAITADSPSEAWDRFLEGLRRRFSVD